MKRLLTLGLVLLLSACSDGGSGSSSESTSAPEPASTLKVGYLADALTGIVKDSSGSFDDAAYEIEWIGFDSSAAMLEALVAGAIDVAPESQIPVAVVAQGNSDEPWTEESSPVKAVAAWEYVDSPGFALIVSDTSIADAKGLAGGKVAFARGSMGHVFWTMLADEFQLADVETVMVPGPEARAAYVSGAVDGLITGYHNAMAFEETGQGKIVDVSSRTLGSYCVTLVRTGALEDDSMSEAIGDFLIRFAAGYEWLLENPGSAIDVEIEKFGTSEAVAGLAVRYKSLRRIPLDDSVAGVFQNVADSFVGSAVIPGAVDPTIVFDTRFAEADVN